MTTTGYRPASHPVLRRQKVVEVWEALDRMEGGPLGPSASEVSEYSERLDNLGLLVAHLPTQPPTPGQRRALLALGNELLRRSRA